MPRKARIVVPNTPHHIVQRGHNKQVVFVSDDDYQYYLENVFEWKEQLNCKVYAWCLMTNHIHFIINPGDEMDNLGKLMKRLAGKQTRYVNRLEKRTGSLWEGRYKSSPIETDTYLLACCRYVELNPVRATMVEKPEDYCWSSYQQKIGLKEQNNVDKDACYLSLGDTQEQRIARYKQWVESDVSEQEIKSIREAMQHGHPTGSQFFTESIEKKLGVRLSLNKPGRPKKDLVKIKEAGVYYGIN